MREKTLVTRKLKLEFELVLIALSSNKYTTLNYSLESLPRMLLYVLLFPVQNSMRFRYCNLNSQRAHDLTYSHTLHCAHINNWQRARK